jgi:hypothetical protein
MPDVPRTLIDPDVIVIEPEVGDIESTAKRSFAILPLPEVAAGI